MPTLTDPAVIKELLQRHGFSFSRALGQNFIINPGVCPKMAELGGAAPGVGVLEIGPGFGVLTAELCRRAEKVVAIELDDRLPPILAETLAEFKNVTIVQGDAMVLDLPALIAEHFAGMPVVVCANLPYYITSPIIMRLLEGPLPIRSLTVMVQKEAAVRITAAPGTRECGAISAAVWYYSTPKLLFPVSRGSFLPAPGIVLRRWPNPARSGWTCRRSCQRTCRRGRTSLQWCGPGLASGAKRCSIPFPPGCGGRKTPPARCWRRLALPKMPGRSR